MSFKYIFFELAG